MIHHRWIGQAWVMGRLRLLAYVSESSRAPGFEIHEEVPIIRKVWFVVGPLSHVGPQGFLIVYW